MANRNNIHGINRATALVLALVWLCVGGIGVAFGVLEHRWVLVAVGIAAIAYAILWSCVAARSRLLTWRQLAAPWRTSI